MLNRDNVSALLLGIAVIALIVGFGIYFNNPALNKASSSSIAQQKVEKLVSAATTQNGTVTTIKLNQDQFQHIDKSQFIKAPEFAQITGYINTPHNSPITLSSLKGKVVLVDFWTYSCINCIRTIPYLNDWDQKYADNGLVIIGVHSPEFEFEKNYDNVKAAVQRLGITYPVVLDSDHGTWNAYGNQYWPRDYIIDAHGYIRDNHIGEGGYEQTEKTIQSLLAERAAQMGLKQISFSTKSTPVIKPQSMQYVDLNQSITPEIYLGYDKARAPIGNPEGFKPDQIVSYSIPSDVSLKPSIVYLQGDWKNNPDNIELQSDTARIALIYYAKSVNMVAGGKGEGTVINDNDNDERRVAGDNGRVVLSASSNISNKSLGQDLSQNGSFTIDRQRLYNLAMHNDYNAHFIIIDVKGKGFQLYTFTFG
ncbi:MAG TPA: thioredoxin family protein [Nitrososphaeraceae archaeon]|nr:thioredoxin family protein [Nitrososphaeraceae archaeon]